MSYPASMRNGAITDPRYPRCPVIKMRFAIALTRQQFPRVIDQLHVVADHQDRTSCGVSCGAIPRIIADKWSSREVEGKLPLRCKKHTRLRLATFAAVIPSVGAVVDRINVPALLAEFDFHTVVNPRQRISRQHSPRNSRLI